MVKAKPTLANAKERGLALQAEREFLGEAAQRRRKMAAFSAGLEEQGVTGEEARKTILVRRLGDAAETAKRVALKLGNLKGIFQKALNNMESSMLPKS